MRRRVGIVTEECLKEAEMVAYYKNEKTGEVITEWRYDDLFPEEQEEYLYVGMFDSNMEAEKEEFPKPYAGKRLEIGQQVTGVFERRLGYYMAFCRYHLVGTVIEENRNYFKVRFDGLKLPWWKYYYKDIGVTVFPRRQESKQKKSAPGE